MSITHKVVKDSHAGGAWAATWLWHQMAELDNPRIGLATGGSPIGLYQELVRLTRHAESPTWAQRATFFMLDEYVGLPKDHAQRYRNVLRRQVLDPLACSHEQLIAFDSDAAALPAEIDRYEALAGASPIDVQILGVGANGHVGFNEPPSDPTMPTRIVNLDPRTRQANARFFHDRVEDVPMRAMTRGISEILQARKILVLAFGKTKMDAVSHLLDHDATAEWPVSHLSKHDSIILVTDFGR